MVPMHTFGDDQVMLEKIASMMWRGGVTAGGARGSQFVQGEHDVHLERSLGGWCCRGTHGGSIQGSVSAFASSASEQSLRKKV